MAIMRSGHLIHSRALINPETRSQFVIRKRFCVWCSCTLGSSISPVFLLCALMEMATDILAWKMILSAYIEVQVVLMAEWRHVPFVTQISCIRKSKENSGFFYSDGCGSKDSLSDMDAHGKLSFRSGSRKFCAVSVNVVRWNNAN